MMAARCLSPGTIALLVSEDLTDADRVAADRHLANCGRCTERIALLRRILKAGVDEIRDAMEEVISVTARLLAEPEHRWPLLVRESEYRRIDVAQHLLAIAIQERTRSTRRAAQLAHSAGVIGEALVSETRAAFEIAFEASKLEAAFLRESARYDECRAALVRAEDAADHVRDVESARAAVLLSRALVCAEPDVWLPDEALALLDRAEAAYASRNSNAVVKTLILRGMLMLRRGDADAARTAFESVLTRTSPEDEGAYADAEMNLAHALFELGELESAETRIANAARVNLRHGRTAVVARGAWLSARIQQRRGEHESAITLAEGAMAELEAAGLPDHALRAGLVAVASYAAVDAVHDAKRLCSTLAARSVQLDQREPTRRRSLTAEALAYLRQLSDRSSLTPDVVASVQTYVEEITSKPAVPFKPPLPLVIM